MIYEWYSEKPEKLNKFQMTISCKINVLLARLLFSCIMLYIFTDGCDQGFEFGELVPCVWSKPSRNQYACHVAYINFGYLIYVKIRTYGISCCTVLVHHSHL